MDRENVEIRIHKMINSYKDKYFLIPADTEDIVAKLDDSFNELQKIKKFIEQRLKISNFPPLLSKIYIDNRERMRANNDQFRKEVAARTQCLKAENTVFIDYNFLNRDLRQVLGFNEVPFVHFNFIGLAIGEYKITIPEDLPFGLLYDYEEMPNKNFPYDVEEKSLEISGTQLGETVLIREEKWINAPGDVDDDDKFDSLFNIGQHDFTVKFYTGEITLKVTGNFGVVSYYIKDKGYMGGQKRLKFSELCLNNG